MSLIDPDTRWWRANRTRGVAAHVLMTLGIVGGFVGSWGMVGVGTDNAIWVPQGVAIACIFVAIPLLVGGGLLHAFGVDDDTGSSRVVAWALPLYFVATGTGSILGVYQSGMAWNLGFVVFPVFVAGGIIAIVVIELVRRRSRAAAQLRDRVERSGVTTRGTVTRARSYSVNYANVTRVTVRFTDASGQTRWTRQRIPGKVTKGSQLRVRYSPDDLHQKAAVVVSRR
ncbi:hypothetical protein M1247_35985 [Mycobacterium sp. 21AC1]|uniref:hypothetical protein n=1 Tax=[Mycobacterium] appelbergii TaxID=2939269 RepID=UPI0029391446|nr:hypothetical protein [Mycobacterium sp. 21AC1]MDV3130352.1 hypothetical protein [Mycobacterium sp. 21AC1]